MWGVEIITILKKILVIWDKSFNMIFYRNYYLIWDARYKIILSYSMNLRMSDKIVSFNLKYVYLSYYYVFILYYNVTCLTNSKPIIISWNLWVS